MRVNTKELAQVSPMKSVRSKGGLVAQVHVIIGDTQIETEKNGVLDAKIGDVILRGKGGTFAILDRATAGQYFEDFEPNKDPNQPDVISSPFDVKGHI